jgi:AraC-like DNA-binding protein
LPPVPVVQARILESVFDFLRGTHLQFYDLCSRFGLPDVRSDRDGRFVPLREVLMVEEEISRVMKDEHLGLRLAELSRLDALGGLGLHVRSAPTVGEAIARAINHFGEYMLGARLALASSGPNVVWSYDLSASVSIGRRHSNLFSLTLLRDIVRLAAGRNWVPDQVHLEGVPLGRMPDLRYAFGRSVMWGSSTTALVFRKDLLALPLPRAWNSPPNRPWQPAEGRSGRPASEFVDSLMRLLKSLLPSGQADLILLTRLSGLSARSLQRQLRSMGLSFSGLLDRARLDLAIELMQDPHCNLTDIGLELGYSDAANFTRAFKRWTGVAPRHYRQLAERCPSSPEPAKSRLAGL